eukprot:g2718.t1
MENLFNALQYLHQNKWCHRDIKPENICCSLNDNRITLIDFDFAIIREINENVQEKEDVYKLKGAVGTAGFIPPEMFNCEFYDGMAGDIWSSAITFLELVLHEDLFEKYILQTYSPRNMMDIDVFKTKIYKMLKNIKLCMSEEIYLTQDVQTLIRKMLKLDYSRRPTASELTVEFQQHIKILYDIEKEGKY